MLRALRTGSRLVARAVWLLGLTAVGGCSDAQTLKAARARDEAREVHESTAPRTAPDDLTDPGDWGAGSPSAELRRAVRDEFREATENYESRVTVANTRSLMDVADAYAEYFARFHKHLHYAFAVRALRALPLEGELADPTLVTQVEIVVNADGSLHAVGIIRSSGSTQFDFSSYFAVVDGAPYPPPPVVIRSPDGRAYFRWGLHRDSSQCGVWNAVPMILRQVEPDDLPLVLPSSAMLQRERRKVTESLPGGP